MPTRIVTISRTVLGRCFYCHKKINIPYNMKTNELFWEDHWYCPSCILQVKNGCIQVDLSLKRNSLFHKCEDCGKNIKRRYVRCFQCEIKKNPKLVENAGIRITPNFQTLRNIIKEDMKDLNVL